jgi:mRNA interferase HicA
LKVVSGTHFCRTLRRHGWVHLRTKGSHQTWGKAGRSDITVPVHVGKDLGRGLLAALLKQSGLTEADL